MLRKYFRKNKITHDPNVSPQSKSTFIIAKIEIIQNFFNLFPVFAGFERRKEIVKEQMEFFTSEIAKHQKSLDPSQSRDFIDVYLTERRTNSGLTIDDLACIMADFLAAGTETSSTTLKWIFLYLTLYPSVQERSREEIEHVLGSDRRCEMSHLKSLPYTLSVITEVQRVARVAPISLMHELNKTTKLGDYIFPEGSVWCANLSYITHDPENFKNPFEFIPDRWIGPDGK